MKKLLVTALLLLSITTIYSQVVQLTPLRTSLFRGAVRNFSKTNDRLFTLGYEFGLRSYVAYSTNWGNNWNYIGTSWTGGPFTANDNLNMISFPTNNIGYVGGAAGRLLKTSNGGTTWTDLTDTNRYMGAYNAAWFFSPDTGYVCGDYSRNTHLLRTTNGGTTWTPVETGQTNTAQDMYWENKQNGWVTMSSSKVMRTTDGGATWTNVFQTVSGITLYRISRADVNTFYVCGTSGMVAKSTNGGASFSQVTAPAGTYYAMDWTDANTGFLVGSGGGMIKTTNGGTSWTPITTLYSTEVLKACIKVPDGLVIGGYLSTLLKSPADWSTFTPLGLTSRDIYSVSVDPANPNKILAVGDRGDVSYTTNRGASWVKPLYPNGNLLYDGYINGNQISACGQAGSYYLSTNLGATWTERIFPNSAARNYKMFFTGASTAYMANNAGSIAYTSDAGLTWNARGATGAAIIYDIRMTSATNGWASGNGDRLYRTYDACSTWTHAGMVTPFGQMAAIFMTNDSTGYAGGQTGSLFYTADGFKTVQLLTDTIALNSRIVHDILVHNGTMYAVGTGGLIYVKRPNQALQIVNATQYGEDLLSITKSSTNEIYVSGVDGLVYQLFDNVPVELSSFSASVHNNTVLLAWKTATETNAKDFSLQRKSKNRDWEQIAVLKAYGTTTVPQSYSFTDRLTTAGEYTYRLVQRDFNGTEEIFNGNTVMYSPEAFTVSDVYPNPFNPSAKFEVSVLNKTAATVTVVNALGEKVKDIFSGTLNEGTTQFTVTGEGLSAGIYFVRVTAGETVSVKKFILMK